MQKVFLNNLKLTFKNFVTPVIDLFPRIKLNQLKLQKRSAVFYFGLVSGVYYFQNFDKNKLFYSLTKQQSQQQQEGQPAEKKAKNIHFVKFTDEEYQNAINKKYDIIVLIDVSRFKDEFVEEIEDFLEKFNYFQQMVKGRKLMLFSLEISSKEDADNFLQKYKVQIEQDSILLLKNKYSDQFYKVGSYEYFNNKDFIFQYFKKIQKLNSKNWDLFSSSLKNFTSEQVFIICYADPKDQNYKQYQKKFGIISLFREYAENKNIHILVVNDPLVAQKLGIQKSGETYLLFKSSKFNRNESNLTINDHNYLIKQSSHLQEGAQELIASNSKVFNEVNIFTKRSFDPENYRYTLLLEVDTNKITKSEYNRLIGLFSRVKDQLKEQNKHSDVALILLKKTNKLFSNPQAAYQIYMRDEDKSLIPTRIHQETDGEEINKLQQELGKEPVSFQYLFNNEDLALDSLIKWIEDVKQNKVPHLFKTQQPIPYRKFSRKLVSSDFKQLIIDSETDQTVFFYSKFCHACKHYGGIYEQFAKQNLTKNEDNKIQFNRINSDYNHLQYSENYPYTPVFTVFKKGAKDSPLVYRSDKFTPQLLQDFISVSIEFKLMDKDTLEKLLKEYKSYPELHVLNK